MLYHTGIDTDYNKAYNTLRVPDIFVSENKKFYISVSFDIREAWQFNYQYKYNWNIVESDVKHHNTNTMPVSTSISFFVFLFRMHHR
jgi:hypothetical protein